MSRANKRLGNVALDLLWEDVDVEKLLYLFPSVVVNGRGWQKEFSSFPTDRDWDRYKFYAQRVRTLNRAHGHMDGESVNYRDVLPVLGERGQLVHLQHLLWDDTKINEISGIGMFLVPSLISVEISRDYNDVISLSSSVSALESLLQKLIDLGVFLRTLKLPVPTIDERSEPVLALYQTKLPPLLTRSLSDMEIFASCELLCVLGTIPSLRTLAVRYHPDENCYRTNGHTLEGFTNLQELKVFEAKSLNDVTSMIRATGCVPSDVLKIMVISIPSGYKVTQFLDVVLESDRSRSIRSFELLVGCRVPHRAVNLEVDEDHDDRVVTLTHFRRLMTLDIHHLCLGLGHSLDISNESIKELAAAWPNMEQLHLLSSTTRSPSLPDKNSVSLHGLKYLASLAHLKEATIELKITTGNVPPVSGTVSTSPLEMLDLEGSSIETVDIIPTRLYLASLFPRLFYPSPASAYGDEDFMSEPHDVLVWRRALDRINASHIHTT